MKKVFYIASAFTIFLAATVIFYFFFLLFFPAKTAQFSNITINPKAVNPGDMLHITANYCKTSDSVSTIFRTVETVHDHNIAVPYPIIASNAPIGCGKFELDTILPMNLTPGTYRMNFTIQYAANPIREVSEEFFSAPFQVSK